MQCNFCLIEGDEIKEPLEEIPVGGKKVLK